jgi:hypothetical protein
MRAQRSLQHQPARGADSPEHAEERTLVDRAKGILMKAGGLSEDEAFRILRSASQRNQRRVGQVSRRLIDAARAAEAVNRAGQLRMLSPSRPIDWSRRSAVRIQPAACR